MIYMDTFDIIQISKIVIIGNQVNENQICKYHEYTLKIC